MKPDVMKYEAEKLKYLSGYLGEKKWFAGETVSGLYIRRKSLWVTL